MVLNGLRLTLISGLTATILWISLGGAFGAQSLPPLYDGNLCLHSSK